MQYMLLIYEDQNAYRTPQAMQDVVAAHMRLVTMGVVLLLVLRFSPRGLIPEK